MAWGDGDGPVRGETCRWVGEHVRTYLWAKGTLGRGLGGGVRVNWVRCGSLCLYLGKQGARWLSFAHVPGCSGDGE